jgi:hypothetical protein
LLIHAQNEAHFDAKELSKKLTAKAFVSSVVLEGRHGFMDRFSDNYLESSAIRAERLASDFIVSIFQWL